MVVALRVVELSTSRLIRLCTATINHTVVVFRLELRLFTLALAVLAALVLVALPVFVSAAGFR